MKNVLQQAAEPRIKRKMKSSGSSGAFKVKHRSRIKSDFENAACKCGGSSTTGGIKYATQRKKKNEAEKSEKLQWSFIVEKKTQSDKKKTRKRKIPN